jgi:hypothetical protein
MRLLRIRRPVRLEMGAIGEGEEDAAAGGDASAGRGSDVFLVRIFDVAHERLPEPTRTREYRPTSESMPPSHGGARDSSGALLPA